MKASKYVKNISALHISLLVLIWSDGEWYDVTEVVEVLLVWQLFREKVKGFNNCEHTVIHKQSKQCFFI